MLSGKGKKGGSIRSGCKVEVEVVEVVKVAVIVVAVV